MKTIFVHLLQFVLWQMANQGEACSGKNKKSKTGDSDSAELDLSYMDPQGCTRTWNGKMWYNYDEKDTGGYISVYFILAEPKTQKTNILVVAASSLYNHRTHAERDLSNFKLAFASGPIIIHLEDNKGVPARKFPHELYKPGVTRNNVALLKLPEEVDFPEGITPACVSNHYHSEWIKEHAPRFASGEEPGSQ